MNRRPRITLEVPVSCRDRMDRVKQRISAPTRTATIIQSILLMERIANAMASGGKLLIRDPDGKEREILVII